MSLESVKELFRKLSDLAKKNAEAEREAKGKPAVSGRSKGKYILRSTQDKDKGPDELEPNPSCSTRITTACPDPLYDSDEDDLNLTMYSGVMDLTLLDETIVRDAIMLDEPLTFRNSIPMKKDERKVQFNDEIMYRDISTVSMDHDELNSQEQNHKALEVRLTQNYDASSSTISNKRPQRAAAKQCLIFIENISSRLPKSRKANTNKSKKYPKIKNKNSRQKPKKKSRSFNLCLPEQSISPQMDSEEFSWWPNQSLLDASF